MFAYCRNNPVRRKDISGNEDLCGTCNEDDNPLNDMGMGSHAAGGGSSNGDTCSGSVNSQTSHGGPQASNPLANISYSNKVISGMRGSDFHGFSAIVDNYGYLGTQQQITGGDQQIYNRLEIKGSYLGYDGNFVYIWDMNGICNHRFFEKN